MAYITTEGPTEIVKQRKNKLKGMAMEYAVKKLMEEIEGGEQSLEDILEDAEQYLTDVYTVKKMFRIWDGNRKLIFRRQVREFGEDYRLAFDKNDLQGRKFDIKAPDKSDYVKLGYKKCGNCQFIFPPKFCRKCGGAFLQDRFWVLKKISEVYNSSQNSDENSKYTTVKSDNISDQFQSKILEIKRAEWNAEDKWGRNEFCNCDNPDIEEHFFSDHRKCRKCKSGYFSQMKTEFSKKDWRLKKENVSFDEAREFLLENGYISKSSFAEKVKAKRVDTWKYDGERVQIFESKNKEDTGLSYSNIAQAFYYIKALRKAGLRSTKDAWIIYNGDMPDSLVKSIDHFEAVYGYSISPISFRNWCVEKGVFIEKVVIGKDVEGEKVSETGEYRAKLFKSENPVPNPKIVLEV